MVLLLVVDLPDQMILLWVLPLLPPKRCEATTLLGTFSFSSPNFTQLKSKLKSISISIS